MENFDKPYKLILDHKTILHHLVYSLDKLERDKLIEIAKNVYNNDIETKMELVIESSQKSLNILTSELDPEELLNEINEDKKLLPK